MRDLLSLLVVCLGCHLVSARWSQSHRNVVTKAHNDYRRGVEGACDIPDLVYDKKIEVKAKAWAERCVFQHQMKEFGENLAMITYSNDESGLIKGMVKSWYDEVKDYTYGSYGCGAACHYTQVIWAKTTKLGCYAKHCPMLRGAGPNAYYLVCFYTPAGNMLGEQPYQTSCKGGKSKNSNKGSSTTNNKRKNNRTNNRQTTVSTSNNNNDMTDWSTGTGSHSGFDWNTGTGSNEGWDWNTGFGQDNGWNVVKKTGTHGKNGRWTTYTATRTYRHKK